MIASSIEKFEATPPGEEGQFKGANGLSHPRDTLCRQRNLLVLLVLLSAFGAGQDNHTDEVLRKLVSH
jgi:hypothetical protein